MNEVLYSLGDAECAYLAGYLDRSCFIGVIRYSDKGRTKYTVRINVQCSNRASLKPLCALLGGSVRKTGQSFIWSLGGRRRCAELLRLLLPYLRARKEAANKVIQFDQEWTKLQYPYDDGEILARRDRCVEESLGLKMSWRGE
jgi:hypothetical protein